VCTLIGTFDNFQEISGSKFQKSQSTEQGSTMLWKSSLVQPNWRRIGFPEYQLVQDMIHVANLMSKWEDKVVAGEEVPDDIE
jgi:hypothetical protein